VVRSFRRFASRDGADLLGVVPGARKDKATRPAGPWLGAPRTWELPEPARIKSGGLCKSCHCSSPIHVTQRAGDHPGWGGSGVLGQTTSRQRDLRVGAKAASSWALAWQRRSRCSRGCPCRLPLPSSSRASRLLPGSGCLLSAKARVLLPL